MAKDKKKLDKSIEEMEIKYPGLLAKFRKWAKQGMTSATMAECGLDEQDIVNLTALGLIKQSRAIKAKVELIDRIGWVTRSADRLRRGWALYMAKKDKDSLSFLRSESGILLKRSWELWWHLRWIKKGKEVK